MTQTPTRVTTYQQPHRPLPLRLLNWVGDQLNLNSVSSLDLTEESLLEAAQQASGLSDWGNGEFWIPLRRFLASINTEANLNLIGRYYFRQYFLRLLVNRLQLQADFNNHPETLEVPLNRPLFVVGMFRSGTTFLHNLLSQDPASRWLHVWEALYPSPSPDPATWDSDPRLKQAIQDIKFQDSLAPNFSTAHHIDPKRPAECSRLFEHGFIGHLFEFRANVKAYSDWLQQQDLTEAYRYYRQQLQHLSYHSSGNHWLLKAPAHIYALDALLSVFPDACIVYIHRDPLKVLPSCCSLSTIGRSRFSDQVDLREVGYHWLDRLAEGTERAMQVRQQTHPDRFYDLDYRTLVQDPAQTVRKIYDYFDYSFTPEMETHLQQWIQQNPQHKHGVHRYSLEQFGLTPKMVNERFATYRQQFNKF
jgi:hypothetical protein